MSTQLSQVQLKVSLSELLNRLLRGRAESLGVPVAQFVKHLIIREIEGDIYPSFRASRWLEKTTKKAMTEKEKAVEIKDVHKFFKKL